MNDLTKWELRFMDKAKEVSTYSKDPSTKVGAVIYDPVKRLQVSEGYNGFPMGIKDTPERLNDRETKYKMVLHAESNALDFANCDVTGFHLFIYPFLPCSACTCRIIQNGISKVYAPDYMPERWMENFNLSLILLEEAGIEVKLVKDYYEPNT